MTVIPRSRIIVVGGEIDAVIRALPPCIARLRQMSPFGREYL